MNKLEKEKDVENNVDLQRCFNPYLDSPENAILASYYLDKITNLDDLGTVGFAFKSRKRVLRAQEIKAKKATISVGDKVKFEDNKGKELTGTIAKVNRTRVNVEVNILKRDEQGSLNGFKTVTWIVPITLLDLT